ncbi:MAG: outer membrane beta-barrel protein [Bacteroidaceae bacterium]|nr:outer membrane beta-barrel protein [Bacteroidaceae bacterium]
MKLLTFVLGLAGLTAWAQEPREPMDSLQEARLDSIEMEAEMKGVAVTAQRALVRNEADRITYDAEHDEDSRTLSVLDLLRKVPFVTVDGDDNILVKGSSAFRIYKNGHMDPTLSKNAKDILRTMPASMVRRIEVITSPGAKEDAEGVEAILNIVLKDSGGMEGVTGSLSANFNTLLHPNAGAYLMTQAGRLTASANYGYGGMSKRETEGRYDGWMDYAATGNHVESDSRQRTPGSVHYANVDVSLELDTLNLISASLGGYFQKLNVQGESRWAMSDATGAPLYSYRSHFWMPDYMHHSWQGRADYERRTRRRDERWTLSYMLALTRQHIDDETLYSELSDVPFTYTGLMTRSREHFTEHTWQLDWLRPLSRGHQLETGGKYIYRLNHSNDTQEFYGTSDTTHTAFRHRTQVAALYSDYTYRSEHLSLRAGLRYEYSRMSGRGVHRCLHDLVPRAVLHWQMTGRQSLKAEYVTTMRRPGIEYLNPAVERSPFQVRQGNPALRSSRQQSLYLIYMYMGRRLTLNLAPAVKWSRDGIGTVLTAQGNVHHQTYGNVINHRRLQLEGYLQWKPWEKTTFMLNANLGHDRYANGRETTGNATSGLRLSRFSGFVYAYVQQKMWWRLQLTVAGYGQVGHAIAGVYGYDAPWWAGSMSLQRSFLRDDRLTVRLSANLPFSAYKGYTNHVIQGDYTRRSHQQSRSRSFMLSLSYRFGNLKATVRKAETSIENDDLVGGITKGQ